jgi:hypothetical protein
MSYPNLSLAVGAKGNSRRSSILSLLVHRSRHYTKIQKVHLMPITSAKNERRERGGIEGMFLRHYRLRLGFRELGGRRGGVGVGAGRGMSLAFILPFSTGQGVGVSSCSETRLSPSAIKASRSSGGRVSVESL